jgi:hypothetical protein
LFLFKEVSLWTQHYRSIRARKWHTPSITMLILKHSSEISYIANQVMFIFKLRLMLIKINMFWKWVLFLYWGKWRYGGTATVRSLGRLRCMTETIPQGPTEMEFLHILSILDWNGIHFLKYCGFYIHNSDDKVKISLCLQTVLRFLFTQFTIFLNSRKILLAWNMNELIFTKKLYFCKLTPRHKAFNSYFNFLTTAEWKDHGL